MRWEERDGLMVKVLEVDDAVQPYEVIENLCPKCRAPIFARTKEGRLVELPEFCQFEITLSSGSNTHVGLCKLCFNSLTKEEVDLIFEGVKHHWMVEGWATPKEHNWTVRSWHPETVS